MHAVFRHIIAIMDEKINSNGMLADSELSCTMEAMIRIELV